MFLQQEDSKANKRNEGHRFDVATSNLLLLLPLWEAVWQPKAGYHIFTHSTFSIIVCAHFSRFQVLVIVWTRRDFGQFPKLALGFICFAVCSFIFLSVWKNGRVMKERIQSNLGERLRKGLLYWTSHSRLLRMILKSSTSI